MEIRVLNYFLTVVREGGFNKASEVLHITQPTLSRQIAQLEEEIGVKLFDRSSRTIKLTNEGILLRRRAEEILSLVDRTEQELITQEELVEGHIIIGGGELAAVQLLAEIIDSFHKQYPLVKFDLVTANADNTKEQMERGLVDIGILLEPIEMEKFDFIRLREKEHWVVLMNPEDELASKTSIEPKDLIGFPLMLPRRTNVQNEIANWFGETYKDIDILFTSNLSMNGAVMVKRGLARSIAIEGSVALWDDNCIIARPLSPDMMANSVFAWKKNQPQNIAVEKFIEHIRCFLGISG